MSTTEPAPPIDSAVDPAATDSRTALLEATLELATSRGYAGTRISEVRKRTGASASTVYWHFKNKDALVAAALTYGFEKWTASHPATTTTPGTGPESSLLGRLTHSAATIGVESAFWRLGLMLALEEGPSLGSEPRERFLTIRASVLQTMKGHWREAHPQLTQDDLARLTRLTMAAMDGLYTSYLAESADSITPLVPALAHGLSRLAEELADGVLDLADTHPEPTRAERGPGAEQATLTDSQVALLEAASAVAAESGYTGASIARICAKAGLPASSLYWHFKSKDELFEAVVQHSFDEWRARLPARQSPSAGASWSDALQVNIENALHSFETRPDYWRLGCLLLLQQTPEPIRGRERFLQIRQRSHADLSAWCESVIPADEELARQLSHLVILLSDGLHFSLRLDDTAWEPAILARLTTRLITHAQETLSRPHSGDLVPSR